MPRKLLPFGVATVSPKTSQMFEREHSARFPFSQIIKQSSNAIDFASSSAITLFSLGISKLNKESFLFLENN